jgi:hypothetical protein
MDEDSYNQQENDNLCWLIKYYVDKDQRYKDQVKICKSVILEEHARLSKRHQDKQFKADWKLAEKF